MATTIRCPGCRETFAVSLDDLGTEGPCPECGDRLRFATPLAIALDALPRTLVEAANDDRPPKLEPLPRSRAKPVDAPKRGPVAPKRRPATDEAPVRQGLSTPALLAIALLGLVGGSVLGVVLVRQFTAKPDVAQVRPSDPPAPIEPPNPKKDPLPRPPKKAPGPTPKLEPVLAKSHKLPVPFAGVAVGGGGRFVILHLPKLRQLAVYDAKQQRFVKYLPVAAEPVPFAAGRDHIFAVDSAAGTMERWSLATFEKEATVKLPGKTPFVFACMGSDSNGPLMLFPEADRLFGTSKPTLINPITTRVITTEDEHGIPAGVGETARVSADGRLFAWQRDRGGCFVAVEADEKKAETKTHTGQAPSASPGPNCRYYYTPSAVYDHQLNRTHPPGEMRSPHEFVPAAHGGLFLEVEVTQKETKARVYYEGQFTPLGTLTELPGITPASEISRAVHLLPRYNQLVLLSSTHDELQVRPFDLTPILAKSPGNYLLVASEPPTEVLAGSTFEYTPDVRSKNGGVKVKLDAGPDGMSLADGTLTWDVPSDMVGKDATVSVSVSDASGQETFHRFRLVGVAALKQPDPVAVADPKDPKDPANPKPGPNAATIAIGPAPIGKTKTVKLPGPFRNYCLAAGGRYVIFQLPEQKQLAIFDVCEAKVIKSLPLAEADALIAGTADKLFVLNRTANMIEKWDLATFEKELTAPNPLPKVPVRIAGPHGALGPLYFATVNRETRGEIHVIHAGKLVPIDGVKPEVVLEITGPGAHQGALGVSANGAVVCAAEANPAFSGGTSAVFTFDGNKLIRDPGPWNTKYIYPSPDGKSFHTGSGVRVGARWISKNSGIPAADGNGFFLSFAPSSPITPRDPPRLWLFSVGESEPIAELDQYEFPQNWGYQPRESLDHNIRTFFVEAAHVAIALPPGNTEIVMLKADPWTLLAKAKREYLLVTSPPPLFAIRGTNFAYTPAVRSSKGGVTVELVSGPPGMKLTGETLSWAIPPKIEDFTVPVVLRVSDSSGKSVFQNFDLRLLNESQAPKSLPGAPLVAVAPPEDPMPPPAAQPGAVRPTWAGESATITLAGKPTNIILGGGGRFLLFPMFGGEEVVVVDVNTGQVAKTIPLTSSPSHVAAGAKVAVIYYPKTKKLEVWGLEKLERLQELDAPRELTKDPLTSFVMGSASEGPICFHQRAPKLTGYFDLETLKVRTVPIKKFGYGPLTLDVSADGTLLVGSGGGWAGVLVAQFRNGQVEKTTELAQGLYDVVRAGTPTPSANGRVVLSPLGAFSPELTGKAANPGTGFLAPAAEPGFYLRVSPMGGEPGPKDPAPAVQLTLFDDAHERVAKLPMFPEFEGAYQRLPDWNTGGYAPVPKLAANRFIYYPSVGLLSTLSGDNRKVVLRKVGLPAELKKAGN